MEAAEDLAVAEVVDLEVREDQEDQGVHQTIQVIGEAIRTFTGMTGEDGSW